MTAFNPARVAKAIAAAVAAAQIALGTAQAGSGGQSVIDWSAYQWTWFGLSVIMAFVAVYAIPNAQPEPELPAPPEPPVLLPLLVSPGTLEMETLKP